MPAVHRAADGNEAPFTVLVVDDHQTFAELLALALEAEPSLRYVGHARTSAEAVKLVEELGPDVVLMDVELPDSDGLATTELVLARRPDTRVVILTAHSEPALVARAAAAGASGFLPKGGALRDVLHALHTAHHGGMIVSSHLLAGLFTEPAVTSATPVPGGGAGGGSGAGAGLTAREYEVLRLMGGGMDVRSIAAQLNLSVHTCRGYIKAVLAKLDAHSQLEAVVIAIRRGLLSPDEPTG
jgi:DNA-binding NarL/FixJ family response regulator